MREILVVNNNQKSPQTSYYVMKNGTYDVGAINYITPENLLNERKFIATKEQIPETWDDFLKITKGKSGIQQSSNNDWIELTYHINHTIDGKVTESIMFYKSGLVSFNNGVSIKRSIQQMYSLYLGFGNN